MYALYETASGYALFDVDDQIPVEDFTSVAKTHHLVSFLPFQSAADALSNTLLVSEGICSDTLKNFLEINVKGKKTSLAVSDKNLAGSIKQELGIDCVSNDNTFEIFRNLRTYSETFLKQLKEGDLAKAQLGLGHAYSRSKVKFNVNKSDNMIIQAINLLDQLDKDINSLSMRVREWYGWHFPELVKIVNDHYTYAKLAKFIKNKSALTESDIPALEDIIGDPVKAKHVLDAARSSMGTDFSDVDLISIQAFTDRVISLAEYRKKLHSYLNSKMSIVAPNLSSLIGEMVGARLISHAGSLTNLSKYPASTVQILGAEKALFRALRTKGNTPKYGLIYHSTFIGRAQQKNKGRISRFLANKCSIASRIDCFVDQPTTTFGEMMREQVEERLKFYEQGTTPRPNESVMQEAVDKVKKEWKSLEEANKAVNGTKRQSKEDPMVESPKKKKKKNKEEPAKVEKPVEKEEASSPEKKKKKKNKAEKEQAEVAPAPVVEKADTTEKKKKKKKEKS